MRRVSFAALLLVLCNGTFAAPDEFTLGRDAGYPVAHKLSQIHDPGFIVGSFSALDTLAPHCLLAPSEHPLALPVAVASPAFEYKLGGKTFTLDDYLQRQRATAVLVLKDGAIEAERYNYGRTPDMRMLSNSMAKTLVALSVGQALAAGEIRSVDDTASRYVPQLKGTL